MIVRMFFALDTATIEDRDELDMARASDPSRNVQDLLVASGLWADEAGCLGKEEHVNVRARGPVSCLIPMRRSRTP